MAFKLTPKFLAQYEGKQPAWGFGILSYVTFKRTYARTKCPLCNICDPHYFAEDITKEENPCRSCKVSIVPTQEEYFDVCRRVTEGTFEIQRKHCEANKLPWSQTKAQKTAQDFFKRIWEFKFTPPGRGFWTMGTPVVEKIGSASLNNCFGGETEFLTFDGIKTFNQTHGTVQKILTVGPTGSSYWTDAEIKSFGKQKLVKLTVSRSGITKDIYTTANHKWFVKDRRTAYRDKGWSIFETKDLRPGISKLRSTFGHGIKDITPSPFGIAQGFAFGDGGHVSISDRASDIVNLCGKKDKALEKFFSLCPKRGSSTEEVTVYTCIPNFYKKLPDITENKSFLVGWLAGYLAADGTVKANGNINISSSKLENIEFVRNVCSVLGIGTFSISKEERISNLTNRPFTMYRIGLFAGHLMEDFFVLEEHKKNFIENNVTLLQTWNVLSIEETERFEEVYCAVVPDTHNFTLADNILTHNCGACTSKDISIEFADPFVWAMDMLMLGVGVGFDTRGAGTLVIKKPTKPQIIFVIPDSREGWVESVRLLLNSYQSGGNIIQFDYSQIRKRGLPIRGFGGTASGPDPLRELHESLRVLLDKSDGLEITSITITDIMDFIAKCVVAGNIRRSALLGAGHSDDDDFLQMKDPSQFSSELQDRRWAANHSVFVDKSTDFSKISEFANKNGEPGLLWLDNINHFGRVKDGWIPFEDDRYDNALVVNPCSEITLEDRELCNLVEVYPAHHASFEDYCQTLKCAYLYSKSITLVPTHSERTNSVMLRNRRIGCSLTGIQQAIKKFGRAQFLDKFCDEGYKILRHWDRVYSKWLCIPRSIRVSTVKPSGSVSLLAGATPGIHWTHSEYYFRTVRIAANSPLATALFLAGYRIEVAFTDNAKLAEFPGLNILEVFEIQDGGLASNGIVRYKGNGVSILNTLAAKGVTLVVYFPVHEQNFTKSKFDVTLWEQLCLVREMQYYWSDNAVSCTITVKEHERDQLKDAIEYFAPYVKTLSFLPLTNHKYHQAPYIECSKEDFEAYSARLGKLHLDTALSISGEKFCTNDTCAI